MSKQNTIREVPFGTTIKGKKNGAFLAISFKSKLYKDYNDPQVDPNQIVDLVLMVNRWDGLQGFIGGFVDEGESLEECVRREVEEEANLDLTDLTLEPLCSHELDRVVVHLFHLEVGMADPEFLRDLLSYTAQAKHAVTEGNLVYTHLKTYDEKGRGLKNTLNSNMLASAVKEELLVLTNRLQIPIEYKK